MKQTLFLFRKDLRIQDNPAYFAACERGKVLPMYIFDDLAPKPYQMGQASKLFLHHTLLELEKAVDDHLLILKGSPKKILLQWVEQENIDSVFVNESFEPWYRAFDQEMEEVLRKKGVGFEKFSGCYLRSPEEVVKDDGKPFSVFTPFKKKSYQFPVRKPLGKPSKPQWIKVKRHAKAVESLSLLPKKPWGKRLEGLWEFGEKGAQKKLAYFLEHGLENYKKGRDFPAGPNTSLLSPYLAHGVISPHEVWHKTLTKKAPEKDLEHFLSELTWREFSYYLLYHFPQLPEKNFQKKFDNFPWKAHSKWLLAWQKGETGYPIVDAGMRQLWQTGYMHNRLRMVVGSFLVKNLLIHWHEGRDWFWDCLVDADIANNSAGWQWIAGSGADAAPYFRIFSPRSQVEKFDPEGEYVRHYVPELASLPQKYLAEPWLAPESALRAAGIVLGKDYPHPIVDVKESRQRALEAFQSLKAAH
ncbi:MAG: deoxyribodipyrimidine photo-lyase [Chlamydiota bacterium]